MSQLPLIYVAHPFGGNQFNLDRAEAWTAELNLNFDALFVAPWIPQCRHWENSGRALERGVALNESFIRRSDALITTGGHISPGMEKEIQSAKQASVPCFIFSAFATPWELLRSQEAVNRMKAMVEELRP